MSYKNKKIKKSFLSQLKRRVGLVKIALLKKYKSFITKNKNNMQQRQTVKIMQWLRDRSRAIRPNNLKVKDWVGEYIERCILNGKPVEILTQYCLSKDLEKRYEIQGNTFTPLASEVEMFTKDIPVIMEMFRANNVSVNWYVTFNNSFLDRGRVSEEIVEEYMNMIRKLSKNEKVSFFNWEKDILGKRPDPNQRVLENFKELVSGQAFEIDMKNLLARVEQYSDFNKTEKELRNEAMFKIACEAEEGRFIVSSEAPFSGGDILIFTTS